MTDPKTTAPAPRTFRANPLEVTSAPFDLPPGVTGAQAPSTAPVEGHEGEGPPTEPEPTYRRGFLQAAFQQASATLSAGGPGGAPKIPQRELSFRMSATACAPGMFPEDFRITLRSLTPADEEAIAGLALSATNAAFRQRQLAMKMIIAVNGDPLRPGEDEFLWGALGMTGRAIVLTMCNELSGGGDSMGKALASISVTSR